MDDSANYKRGKGSKHFIRITGILALLLPATLPAQVVYFSPGLQIGFTPKKGVSISYQITVGLLVSVPYPVEFVIPGVTVGIRRSKDQSMRYMDGQLSYLFWGAGVGKVWIRPKKEKPNGGEEVVEGIRYKGFIGYIGYLTYDAYKVPGSNFVPHSGIIVVCPIPVVGYGPPGV